MEVFIAPTFVRQEVRRVGVESAVEEALEEAQLGPREVAPLLRFRVIGMEAEGVGEEEKVGKGIITLWRPQEDQVPLHFCNKDGPCSTETAQNAPTVPRRGVTSSVRCRWRR